MHFSSKMNEKARIVMLLDLAKRMVEAKIELAEKTYDRLDNAIRRMDTDLKRMEVRGMGKGNLVCVCVFVSPCLVLFCIMLCCFVLKKNGEGLTQQPYCRILL